MSLQDQGVDITTAINATELVIGKDYLVITGARGDGIHAAQALNDVVATHGDDHIIGGSAFDAVGIVCAYMGE